MGKLFSECWKAFKEVPALWVLFLFGCVLWGGSLWILISEKVTWAPYLHSSEVVLHQSAELIQIAAISSILAYGVRFIVSGLVFRLVAADWTISTLGVGPLMALGLIAVGSSLPAYLFFTALTVFIAFPKALFVMRLERYMIEFPSKQELLYEVHNTELTQLEEDELEILIEWLEVHIEDKEGGVHNGMNGLDREVVAAIEKVRAVLYRDDKPD